MGITSSSRSNEAAVSFVFQGAPCQSRRFVMQNAAFPSQLSSHLNPAAWSMILNEFNQVLLSAAGQRDQKLSTYSCRVAGSAGTTALGFMLGFILSFIGGVRGPASLLAVGLIFVAVFICSIVSLVYHAVKMQATIVEWFNATLDAMYAACPRLNQQFPFLGFTIHNVAAPLKFEVRIAPASGNPSAEQAKVTAGGVVEHTNQAYGAGVHYPQGTAGMQGYPGIVHVPVAPVVSEGYYQHSAPTYSAMQQGSYPVQPTAPVQYGTSSPYPPANGPHYSHIDVRPVAPPYSEQTMFQPPPMHVERPMATNPGGSTLV